MRPKPNAARERLIRPDQPQQHQARSNGALDNDREQSQKRAASHAIALRKSPERPNHQQHDGDHREPAGQSVRKLDYSAVERSPWDDFPVAQRPMIAASSPRTRGSHESSPNNHSEVQHKDGPRIRSQSGFREHTAYVEGMFLVD